MKKLVFICLLTSIISAQAEILVMDDKNPLNNQLVIDKMGLYRYKSGKETYQKECEDIYVEDVKKKCMEAERAVWAKTRPLNELSKEGTLFTGKIKEGENYFYVTEGVKQQKVHLLRKHLYFERTDDQDILYDIQTEEPYSGELVIGGVEALSVEKGKGDRFIAKQKYTQGLPDGNPTLWPVDKEGGQ